ncbi:MAG: hypothetical protein QG657_2471 [Acidobacteriota bacterium]|nr:hypothetical protein [Acidobacteriota bacterium]
MANRGADLSKHRLNKAKDELEASKLLFENKKLSQSINRSYYSIFHAVRALLALENFDSRKHTGVIAFFNKQFVKTGKIGKEYSKILMDAQDFRNDSDYDDFFLISKDETLAQLNDASRFIEMIEGYIKENY